MMFLRVRKGKIKLAPLWHPRFSLQQTHCCSIIATVRDALSTRNRFRVGPAHLMAAHSQKHFTIILPNASQHTVSVCNFTLYRDLGLIRVSKANVGRVCKWLRAWPVADGLRFEVVTPPNADEYALRVVHFLWLRIMSLATFQANV